jgi:nucleoid-associated protein YejK
MDIQKVIIHELIKNQGVTTARDFLSDSVLDLNEETANLVETLDKSFKRDFINYAVFNEEGQDDFPHYFERYQSGRDNDDSFISFSKSAVLNLKQIIRNVIFAKGGYIVFAKYTVNDTPFIGIYLIRDEKGILFNKNSESHSFSIGSVSYLNTNKLAMGCRINLIKYTNRDGRYVAMIKNNLVDISDYFRNWINIVQPESSTEYTNALFQIVSTITSPVNPETNQPYPLDEFRKNVHDYVKSRPNKTVNMAELGRHFYDDETVFIQFAEDNNHIIDTEFKVDGRSLKKFCHFDIRADGIRLLFARGDYDTKVRLSEDDNDKVIIESRAFANRLRNEYRNGDL